MVVGKNADKYHDVDVKEFTITYTNPCPFTAIIPRTISEMTQTVYGETEQL